MKKTTRHCKCNQGQERQYIGVEMGLAITIVCWKTKTHAIDARHQSLEGLLRHVQFVRPLLKLFGSVRNFPLSDIIERQQHASMQRPTVATYHVTLPLRHS